MLAGTPCEDVFVERGGRWSFRQPADANVPGFVVEEGEIQGPMGSCRVVKRATGAQTTLSAECHDAVSVDRRTIVLRRTGPNEVERLDPGTGTPTTFTRCHR